MREPATTAVPAARAAVYLHKAEQFLDLAESALEAGKEDAAAPLSVHAAISAADAITVAKSGRRSTGANHLDVLWLLDRCDLPAKEELRKQLRAVLGRKNLVEYEDRLLPRGDGPTLVKQASRIVEAARGALAPSSSRR